MIGAGDIKLFCALGGIMGCESIIKCIFISFLTGAGISAALLIFNHNFCERILYFIEYVKCTVGTERLVPIGEKILLLLKISILRFLFL